MEPDQDDRLDDDGRPPLASPVLEAILENERNRRYLSESLSYTGLRESISVDDKGKFNYHLRKLEPLVCTQDGEYTLTNRGETFIQRIISEDVVLNREELAVEEK